MMRGMVPPNIGARALIVCVAMAMCSGVGVAESGKVEVSPLGDPAGGKEAETLFQRLAQKQTGLDFTMQLGNFTERVKEYLFITPLGGVATGDCDGDGKPDIYLTSPSGGNRLFRNLGGFKFEDITQKAGVADPGFWGTGASFVDIDDDGDLDLYACGYRVPNKLYINDGKGGFTDRAAEFGLDFNGASMSMTFADIDDDGDLDGYLATTTQPPPPGTKFGVRMVRQADGSQKPVVPDALAEYWELLYLPGKKVHRTEAGQADHLFRNDGGKFVDVSKSAGIDGNYFTLSATWWDYDADGDPDLYVSNDFTGPDKLYRNRGDGTFEDVIRETVPHTPWFSMGSDIGDVDGDGRVDLFATDMSATTHYRDKIMMGNMDNMGWFLEFAEPRQYMRNALYLNTGTHRMKEAAFLAGVASTDWSWSPRLEDFDGDGRIDLFVTNGILRDSMHSDVSAMAEQRFRPGSPEWRSFWAGQSLRKERNLAFRNGGDIQFERVGAEWGLDREGVSFGCATADFDGDGDLDLVVNNADAAASVYRNRSKANRVVVRLHGTRSNRFGVGAKVEIEVGGRIQVREITPVRGWLSSNEPIAQFGLGNAASIDRLTVRWPSGAVQVAQDVSANMRITLTEPRDALETAHRKTPATMFVSLETGIRHREKPFDDFGVQPLLPNKLSQRGPGMAWADIDGDSDPDLFLGGARGFAGRIFENRKGKLIGVEVADLEADSRFEDNAAVFFDADGDGDVDLLVGSGSVEDSAALADRLYLNDAKGSFSRAGKEVIPAQPFNTSAFAVADFDKDGDNDVFVGRHSRPGAYPLSHPSILLTNDGGKFTPALVRGVQLATAALASDIDGDDWPDLLVTTEWGGVLVFRNKNGQLSGPENAIGENHTGWWNGIAAGDVDGDGDLDFAVTNYGLNTKYKANPEKPARLFYGDFDGSGKRHLVEAKYEGDILYPIRGFSCSRDAMPFLDDKLKTFHKFASSSLMDIYSELGINQSTSHAATTLESGILLNDGKGRFKWRALPRLAQIAPSFGVGFADFDADGHLDLAIAQNSFSPQRETGRMAGGLSMLLLGDGAGGFAPVPSHRSGLMISGDAVGLGIADFNGDQRPDLAISENNGPLHLLLRR